MASHQHQYVVATEQTVMPLTLYQLAPSRRVYSLSDWPSRPACQWPL